MENGLSNNTKLGQHFLIDQSVIDLMTKEVKENGEVLEIGAGDGRLTRELLTRANKVVAVEIDERFKPDLVKLNNTKIIIANVLDLDLEQLMSPGFQIISSIPYHISEPFLHKIITLDISNAVMLVGDGLIRGNGKLSLLLNTFFDVKLLSKVSKKSFFPIPRTDSVIIKLTSRKSGKLSNLIIKRLFLTSTGGGLLKNILQKELGKQLNLTQKQAKEKVTLLRLDRSILDKSFDQLNNKEIESFCYNLRHYGDSGGNETAIG